MSHMRDIGTAGHHTAVSLALLLFLWVIYIAAFVQRCGNTFLFIWVANSAFPEFAKGARIPQILSQKLLSKQSCILAEKRENCLKSFFATRFKFLWKRQTFGIEVAWKDGVCVYVKLMCVCV